MRESEAVAGHQQWIGDQNVAGGGQLDGNLVAVTRIERVTRGL